MYRAALLSEPLRRDNGAARRRRPYRGREPIAILQKRHSVNGRLSPKRVIANSPV